MYMVECEGQTTTFDYVSDAIRYAEIELSEKSCKVFTYHSNGVLSYEWYYVNGERHRDDGPACIAWSESGNKILEDYYYHGMIHREDGPTCTSYYEDGRVSVEEYWQNDNFHRENGPAIIHYDNSGKITYERYYVNGKLIDPV